MRYSITDTERDVLAKAKLIKARVAQQKKQRRADREAALALSTIKASQKLGTKLYGVIYADPPWRFEPFSRETGMDRAADNHYPTMTFDALRHMEVPAAPDCVLFLWATAPMLLDAVTLMGLWGFQYKTHFIWNKNKIGTGYWNRNKHELLLLGTIGNVPAPAMGEQFASVIDADVGVHSAKPHAFAQIIEQMFPTVPKLEMFARKQRDGWDVWGSEVEDQAA